MLKRELKIFLIAGVVSVLIDFVGYRSLIWLGWGSVNFDKTLSCINGTIFSYFANRFWTFDCKVCQSGSAWRFAALYAITLAINVSINSLALKSLAGSMIAIQLAFLIATGSSALCNFLGMKFFVFKSISSSEIQ